MIKPIVILIGAFERDNLGDILFSKIFKKILPDYKIINCGLINNDLSSIGGDKVLTISSIKSLNLNPVAVIHCGGETLTCSKEYALKADLDKNFYKKISSEYNSAINEINDAVIPEIKFLGYVYDHSDMKINCKVPVGFISVGGSDPKIFDKNYYLINQLKSKLKNSKCLIVRDKTTYNNLIKYTNTESEVYPDIVHIFSEIYKPEIDITVSKNSFFQKFKPDSYIVFQANEEYILKNNTSNISDSLINIAQKNNKAIVIQPMGLANLHDSNKLYEKILIKIKKNSKIKIVFQSDRNIWKQVAVLAKSHCNIGTSLHFRIISTSFSRHCISLENSKVTNYLNSWKQDNQPYNVKLPDLESAYNKSFLIKDKELLETKLYFINKSIQNLNLICRKLEITPNFNRKLTNFNDSNIFTNQLLLKFTKVNESLITTILELQKFKKITKQLKIDLEQTNRSLSIIKSSKLYILWDRYCKIKRFFLKKYDEIKPKN